ncbi:cation:proton antiporter [Dongshaea marina]|uniref:cation:proton antiporter n=1 Tax=Dongshaea marina TaxID=2047966 RepID=UPI000D3EC5C8|nr:sodium:proton antiporter [Dongshaea marina]
MVIEIKIIVFLLFIAALAASLLRKIRMPFTVGLVLIGMLLGYLGHTTEFFSFLSKAQLTPDFILYLIVPTLIFEASMALDVKLLKKNLLFILMLAIPGLLISTAIIGIMVGHWTPLPLLLAFLFGALISATDPVAVIALFRELGVCKRLTMLVDGESVLNDATAIVLFTVLMGMITALAQSGQGISLSAGMLGGAVFQFFKIFIGGAVSGAVIGFVLSWLIRVERGDPLIQIALSTVIAYVAYIIPEHLGFSGIMAVMSAGIVFRIQATKILDHEVHNFMEHYWEYAAFVANALIFLLLGLTEDQLFANIGRYTDHGWYIVIAVFAVLVSRFILIPVLMSISNRFLPNYKVDWRRQLVMWWGGLRGAIPIALVLSLPKDLEYRHLIMDMTFGVVLFTLVVQGMTIHPLMKKLKLT